MRLQIAILVAFGLFGILQSTAFANRDPRLDQSSQLYQRGDYQGALSLARQVQRHYPTDSTTHYMIGLCLQKLGKTAEAKTELDWVARNSPKADIRALALKALSGVGSAPSADATAPTTGATSRVITASSAPRPASSSAKSADPLPRNLVKDSVNETIRAAAAVGWKPCTGKCLNINTPGWHKESIHGYPDDYYWVTYPTGERLSTYHWGEVVDPKDPKPGPKCTVCGGQGWIPVK